MTAKRGNRLIASARDGRSNPYANLDADGIGTGSERILSMARIRNLLVATLLGMGSTGCSYEHLSIFHCSECDNFPLPGAMSTSMMPGTYTGPPSRDYYGTSEPMTATTPGPDGGELAPVPTETAPPAPVVTPTPPVPSAPPGS